MFHFIWIKLSIDQNADEVDIWLKGPFITSSLVSSSACFRALSGLQTFITVYFTFQTQL